MGNKFVLDLGAINNDPNDNKGMDWSKSVGERLNWSRYDKYVIFPEKIRDDKKKKKTQKP